MNSILKFFKLLTLDGILKNFTVLLDQLEHVADMADKEAVMASVALENASKTAKEAKAIASNIKSLLNK